MRAEVRGWLWAGAAVAGTGLVALGATYVYGTRLLDNAGIIGSAVIALACGGYGVQVRRAAGEIRVPDVIASRERAVIERSVSEVKRAVCAIAWAASAVVFFAFLVKLLPSDSDLSFALTATWLWLTIACAAFIPGFLTLNDRLDEVRKFIADREARAKEREALIDRLKAGQENPIRDPFFENYGSSISLPPAASGG